MLPRPFQVKQCAGLPGTGGIKDNRSRHWLHWIGRALSLAGGRGGRAAVGARSTLGVVRRCLARRRQRGWGWTGGVRLRHGVGIARRAAGGIALRTLLAVARPWRRLRRPSQGSARRSMPWRPNLYSSRRSGCLSHALRRRLSPGCGPPHGRSTGLAKKRAGEPSLALAGAVRASAVARARRHQATPRTAARPLPQQS